MNSTPLSSPPAPPPASYLGRLWAALLGRTPPPTTLPASTPPAPPGEGELRGQISVLEASLAEAREKMGRMREEYTRLDQEKARAVAGAGAAELERVFKKLAPPLAMLSTLAHKTRGGENVLAADLAQTVVSVEKALAAGGLERIGEAGTTVPYDSALHARMSGGAATPGEPVVLQLPGYRLGAVILHKAMVAVADKPGQTA